MKALHLVGWWPSSASPIAGTFIKRHVDLTRQFADIQVAHGLSSLIWKMITFRPNLVHVHVMFPHGSPGIRGSVPELL